MQSERDGLLYKLSKSAATGGGTGGSGAAGDGKGGGALLARMKARVAELESRIKENRLVSALVAFYVLLYLRSLYLPKMSFEGNKPISQQHLRRIFLVYFCYQYGMLFWSIFFVRHLREVRVRVLQHAFILNVADGGLQCAQCMSDGTRNDPYL